MEMWMVFFWSGPIGLGIFFLCLGTFIFLATKADIMKKRAEKEKQ